MFRDNFKENIFLTNTQNFNEKALELFQYQAKENQVYKKYLQLLKRQVKEVQRIEDIPFLPISFFKHHPVISTDAPVQITFRSSGTTGLRSTHHVNDTAFYKKISERCFERMYGPLSDYIILALVPSYQENPHSSLLFMIDHFMNISDPINSRYIDFTDMKNLPDTLSIPEDKKVLLIGVTYALMESSSLLLDLPQLIIMETGGMKGRGKELTREEVHSMLKKGFKVETIHSEYGMTELISQSYSRGEGKFEAPPWKKILLRDLNDPFLVDTSLRAGGINIIDFGNVDSCSFIATEDLGRIYQDETFSVIGRIDNSEMRGCNQMIFE